MGAQDETKVQSFSLNCNQCRSYDFNIGNVYGHGWGSVFLEVEAWGGHQGGGMHGCYFHGKYALNAYQSMITLNGNSPVSKGWGNCGTFTVSRPGQTQSKYTSGCGGAHTSCEDGTRSVHGWHCSLRRPVLHEGHRQEPRPWYLQGLRLQLPVWRLLNGTDHEATTFVV